MGLPNIEIIFKRLAQNATSQNKRSVVALIIKDSTSTTFTMKEYTSSDDVDKDAALFTTDNLQYIKDVFIGNITKVIVIRINAVDGVITDALNNIAGTNANWIGIAEGAQADQDAVVTFIKAQENLKKTFKAVVFNPTTAPDNKHIVVLQNTDVTFKDSTRGTNGKDTGEKYIASLLGILAGVPLNESSTYKVCSNLSSVTVPADINASIDAGNLVLINDDGIVKVGRGVTSLSTVTEINTEDMKKIAIMEAIDLMHDDITSTYKNSYVGKYKNRYDNQIIFVSAVNSYFKTLAGLDVLDEDYDNICSIDIDAQRAAWIADGKTEAKDWKDADVLNNSFKSNVFVKSNIKILDAMEDLDLTNNLY